MLAAYESVADINVLIVDFATEANNSGWLGSAAAVNAYLAGLDANGLTNYNGAIQEVMASYEIGLPEARQSLVYFLTDGKPEPASTSLQARGTIDDWEGFLADNGAEVQTFPDGGVTPFKGGKLTTWEGGMRAPCVIRWPGVVKPGTVFKEMFS